MAPLPQSDPSAAVVIYNMPKPDPKLFAYAIIGARFTPIHVLMIFVMTFFPLILLLAYGATAKEWTFEKYVRAKREENTPMPGMFENLACIDLETALGPTNPDDASLGWEVNEEDIRTHDSPEQVFSERVLEECLLQVEKETEEKEREQADRGKQKQKEGETVDTRSNTKPQPSPLSYEPLTADEIMEASDGLEPILYTGGRKYQVYYNAHQKK